MGLEMWELLTPAVGSLEFFYPFFLKEKKTLILKRLTVQSLVKFGVNYVVLSSMKSNYKIKFR